MDKGTTLILHDNVTGERYDRVLMFFVFHFFVVKELNFTFAATFKIVGLT